MKKFSLIAASLLLASNLSANSLADAIKGGELSGDVTLYGEQVSTDGSADTGFTNGSIGLGYETASFNGLKAAVGLRSNHDFSEKNVGDFDGGNDEKSILHTANISYSNDMFGLTIGRQEIDLEWLGDFHEAVVASVNSIADTSLVVGYTNRFGVADPDAVLEAFTKINTNKGAYVIDAKYEGIKDLVINPYFYDLPNLSSWYGLKADYDTDMFGLTAHYASSSEDTQSDGEISHFELRTTLSGLSLSAGYITTDDKVGAGSMTAQADNISPLEEGSKVYDADANTLYLSAGYEVSGIELGLVYGKTDFANFEEKELNLTVDYGFTDNLSAGILYYNIDADESNAENDSNKVALTLEYSF